MLGGITLIYSAAGVGAAGIVSVNTPADCGDEAAAAICLGLGLYCEGALSAVVDVLLAEVSSVVVLLVLMTHNRVNLFHNWRL